MLLRGATGIAKNIEVLQNNSSTKEGVEEEEDQFKVLSVGTHNINGIKTNRGKLDFVIEYIEETNIDILELVETNLSEKEA